MQLYLESCYKTVYSAGSKHNILPEKDFAKQHNNVTESTVFGFGLVTDPHLRE